MPRSILVTALLLLSVWYSAVGAATPGSDLGKSIFEQGIGRDGREIGGRIHGTVILRGQAVACASCHGNDARGGEEAFIRAPDIRWHTLSKPFAPRHLGQARPAYNRSSFLHVIHQGMASNNIALDPAMPRFDLSQDETEALIHYLAHMVEVTTSESEPSKIVLGLFPSASSSRLASELADRLTSCPPMHASVAFSPFEILHYQDPTDAISKVTARIAEGNAAYILAPYIVGWERQYFNAAKDWSIRTILPVTPLDSPAHPNFTFSLPGLNSQIGALLERGIPHRSGVLTVLRSEDILLSHGFWAFAKNESWGRDLRFNEVILEHTDFITQEAPWLILAPLEKVAKKLRAVKPRDHRTILVPAMFFDPQVAAQIETRLPGIVWQIAYPYPPIDAQTGRWRNLTDVWAEAGCTFMTIIAAAEEPPFSVTLKSEMTVLQTADEKRRREQVIVKKWEFH